MNDVLYKGRRMRPRTIHLPEGGYGAKVLIWPSEDATAWTHLVLPRERWETEAEATTSAVTTGMRTIDLDLAGR